MLDFTELLISSTVAGNNEMMPVKSKSRAGCSTNASCYDDIIISLYFLW